MTITMKEVEYEIKRWGHFETEDGIDLWEAKAYQENIESLVYDPRKPIADVTHRNYWVVDGTEGTGFDDLLDAINFLNGD